MNHKNGKLMADLFAATEARATKIRAAGYRLMEKWECQWLEEKRQNQAIRQLVATYDIKEPLKRDALFGGRTNGLRLFQQTIPGETIIRYVTLKVFIPLSMQGGHIRSDIRPYCCQGLDRWPQPIFDFKGCSCASYCHPVIFTSQCYPS